MTAMAIGVCLSGVVTMHSLFPAVLANYPDRACAYCDGYMATVDCRDLGGLYELRLLGGSYLVKAADCATWQPPTPWPRKAGQLWLGDVQDTVWKLAGAPMAPTPALLCEFSPVTQRELRRERLLEGAMK